MAFRKLKSVVRALLDRLGVRPPGLPPVANSGILTIPEPSEVAALVSDLGLEADRIPVREYSWWRPPRQVLVVNTPLERLAWLQSTAPEVHLVSTDIGRDGVRAAAESDAIIGWCTQEMALAAPRLRWVQIGSVGAEEILKVGRVQAGELLVTNLRGVSSQTIALHAMAMLLSLVRQLHVFRDWQRFGEWMGVESQRAPFYPLEGRTLLVVGLGSIGTAISRLADAFGMTVAAIRARPLTPPTPVRRIGLLRNLPEFLASADFVVNALPLTATTRGLFNEAAFSAMKPGAVFLNIARGATVVTMDLIRALDRGHLAGAGLDTTDPEPLPMGHPLWRVRNVIITPHVAHWGVHDTERRWTVMRENLRRFAAGDPMLCVVNPARGY